MTDDAELLRRYAEERSDESFADLVRRHLDFVYGAALRQAEGDHALAQDVTQAVFIDLARKAAALTRHKALVGWLHTATRFGVARVRRAEARRTRRELAAHTPEGALGDSAPEIDWSRLQPVFDEVLGELKERERTAILLRYFEHRPLAEVGARLALSESAARSCIDRALDKMRGALARRGVTSTAAGVGLALAHQMGVAAPAGFAQAVTSAALAGSTASGVAGAFAIFAMTKIELGSLALLLAAGTAAFTWERTKTQAVAAEVAALRSEHTRLAAVQTENRRLATRAVANPPPVAPPATRVVPGAPAAVDEATAALLAAGMKPMSAWRNLGRATPVEALETFLWAGLNADLDVVATMIAFDPAGKAKLDAWFLTLPPAVHAKYGTAERVIAPAFATKFQFSWMLNMQLAQAAGQPTGYKIVGIGQPDRGGTVHVQAVFSHGSDPDRPERIPLPSSPDGWRIARFGESMVDQFVTRIDPVTGEPCATPLSP